jgi:serine/threonine protein kinase
MIGMQILNYQVISLIGEGGMGNVYLAEHVQLKGRKVAIKSLHSRLVKNKALRARFKNEAAAMANLQHPNIVGLIDYLEEEDALYLIMEYVEGIQLDDYLEALDVDPPLDLALHFFSQILDGMEYAHSSGVIHRDIKPENIIVTSDHKLKILDFGIAKLVFEDGNSMTKTGTQMGTVFYMSPEQVQGHKVDIRTDIYSLGVTLYQILTRTNPYYGMTTEFEVYGRIVKEPLPQISNLDNGIPLWMDLVIAKATMKNVEDRFSSCDEFSASIKNKGKGHVTSSQSISITSNSIAKTDLKEQNSTNKAESKPTANYKRKINPIIIVLISVILIIVSVFYYFVVYEPYYRDSDSDGVRDELDDCPYKHGLEKFDGCPDYDNDGIADRFDDCPSESGEQLLNGCPDWDYDGIADKYDKCPLKYGNHADGCFYYKHVKFKNNTWQKIYLAIAVESDGILRTQGWYSLEPYSNFTFDLPSKFEGSEIFWFGETFDAYGTVDGTYGGTDKYLCIDPTNAFDFYGTNCSRKKGFLKLNLTGETTEQGLTY